MTAFGRTGKCLPDEKKRWCQIFCVWQRVDRGVFADGGHFDDATVYNAFLGKYEEFKTFFHGHSYTGNQLGQRWLWPVGSCCISRRPSRRVNGAGLSELDSCGRWPRWVMCDGKDWWLGWSWWRTGNTTAFTQGSRRHSVCEAMARRGVLTRPIGNVIPLCCLIVLWTQLRRMVRVLRESITEVLGAGQFNPRRADALDQFHGFFRRRIRIVGNRKGDHEVYNRVMAPKALG